MPGEGAVRVLRAGASDGAHLLTASMHLRQPLEAVFSFFSDADNLGKITPPELSFRVVSKTPIQMDEGCLIDYELRLLGFPLRWRTLIAYWSPPHGFVDEQLRGPYREWVHIHRFREDGNGASRTEDRVRFRLPPKPLGEVAFPLVSAQLRRIFRYRQKRIRQLLQG